MLEDLFNMEEICIPTGYGSGPYAAMAYAGYEICNTDAENAFQGEEPKSNVRNICIVRCN